MHHLKRTAIISQEGKKLQSHRWKTNVTALSLEGLETAGLVFCRSTRQCFRDQQEIFQ